MPALDLDVALIHMNRADQAGNGQFLGPDPYMDSWFSMAAEQTFLSAEKIIPTEDFAANGSFHTQVISRMHVAGVVEAPGGAHFTECPPDYDRDEKFQKEYAATASSPELWEEFQKTWLQFETEADYQAALAARRES